MALTHILFDLDGTLTDPKEGITRSIQFALAELGYPVPETSELLWCIGPPLKASFGRLTGSADDSLLEKAVFHYRQRFGTVGLFENTPYAGIHQALNDIKQQGFHLLLATSKPHVYAHRILERFELDTYFNGVYGSELDGTRTDKGELIRHLLESERLTPEAVLMVGDREHDILGAKKNGVHTLAVSYGYGTAEEFAIAKPEWVADSPAAVAQFIGTRVRRTK